MIYHYLKVKLESTLFELNIPMKNAGHFYYALKCLYTKFQTDSIIRTDLRDHPIYWVEMYCQLILACQVMSWLKFRKK